MAPRKNFQNTYDMSNECDDVYSLNNKKTVFKYATAEIAIFIQKAERRNDDE